MKVKEMIEFFVSHGLEEHEVHIEYVPLGTMYTDDRQEVILQEKSIEIGKTTLKLLKNNFPYLAEKIVNALKNPVLYWNYFEWIILNGHSKGKKIVYEGILNYESLIKKDIKEMVMYI